MFPMNAYCLQTHFFPHNYGDLKTIFGLAWTQKWKILVRHSQYTDWHVLGNKIDEKCLSPGGSAIVWFCSKIWIEYHRIFALVSTAMKANTVCILVNSQSETLLICGINWTYFAQAVTVKMYRRRIKKIDNHNFDILIFYNKRLIVQCYFWSVVFANHNSFFFFFANFGDALSLSPQNLNCKTHKPTPLAKSVVNVSPNVAVCL